MFDPQIGVAMIIENLRKVTEEKRMSDMRNATGRGPFMRYWESSMRVAQEKLACEREQGRRLEEDRSWRETLLRDQLRTKLRKGPQFRALKRAAAYPFLPRTAPIELL